MKKPRRKYIPKPEINIVPFLDVLLILLIIFITIPSTVIQGFEVNLPSSKNSKNFIQKNDTKFLVIIEVLGSDTYSIVINDKKINRIYSLKTLELTIYTNIMHSDKSEFSYDVKCLIAASKTAQYSEIIQVLDLLHKMGLHSVGMIIDFMPLIK